MLEIRLKRIWMVSFFERLCREYTLWNTMVIVIMSILLQLCALDVIIITLQKCEEFWKMCEVPPCALSELQLLPYCRLRYHDTLLHVSQIILVNTCTMF